MKGFAISNHYFIVFGNQKKNTGFSALFTSVLFLFIGMKLMYECPISHDTFLHSIYNGIPVFQDQSEQIHGLIPVR